METVHLVIDGEPVAKGRPRFYNGHTITPAKTSNYENYVKELYVINRLPKLNGYVQANIIAYFSIPKSTSKKKTQLMLDGTIRPTKRPDIDNIIKIIADALNGLAYNDDSQIVQITASKYYSDTPRVEVTMKEI